MIFPRIKVGLENPETLAQSPNEMREAIHKGSYESAIVRQCMMTAQRMGLSGEDTYVLLAYHALLALERHSEINMEYLMKTPMVPIIGPTMR